MKRTPFAWVAGIAVLAALAAAEPAAAADLVVVANDNHSVNVNGAMQAAKNPPPDNIAIVDASQYPPRLVGTVDAPTSVVGAPTSIWISPDQSWVIVTAATRIDPQNPDKIIPDNRVSVIDLTASPPKVVQTIAAGSGANEISVSPEGNLAMVANRAEGTVSIFAVSDKRLTAAGKISVGDAKSMPSSVKFLPDAERALVTRYGDDSIAMLKIDEAKVTLADHKIVTGVNPYTLDIDRGGSLAAVGNMGGGGTGDICTVSLIDLGRKLPNTIDTVAVLPSPEGIKFSPDGRFVAAASVDGTTRPSASPLFHDHGRLQMLAVVGKHLKPVAEAPVGRWSQGIAFSKDGKTVLVESMIDHGLDVFRWDGKKLVRGPTLDVKGAPAAIRTAWP